LSSIVRSRIHALPIPADAPMRDPRAFLVRIWDGFLAGFALPDFAVVAPTASPGVNDSIVSVYRLLRNDLSCAS
jgi:hypothetical protein